ncbi:hypothetical protein D5S17_26240 [Pseudonocardiaceae bacterium YIM PH 21723]|nr:hypothetical protein D5S17_26240 [Pseudonocardiaceae bacterium YIM PH 21723]
MRWTWLSFPLSAGLGLWSWLAACLLLGMQVLAAVLCVWIEQQRRRTLLGLVATAPVGTQVRMTSTSNLPAVWVEVGRDHAAQNS